MSRAFSARPIWPHEIAGALPQARNDSAPLALIRQAQPQLRLQKTAPELFHSGAAMTIA